MSASARHRVSALQSALALTSLLLLSASGPSAAQLQTTPALGATSTAPTPLVPGVLPATQAFALSAFVEADGYIALLWELPDGYYLYRKSLHLALPDGTPLDAFEVPPGIVLEDEYFGESEVYFARLLLRLPLSAVPANAFTTMDGARQLELSASYQGCAQDKYCYPPQQQAVMLELPE